MVVFSLFCCREALQQRAGWLEPLCLYEAGRGMCVQFEQLPSSQRVWETPSFCSHSQSLIFKGSLYKTVVSTVQVSALVLKGSPRRWYQMHDLGTHFVSWVGFCGQCSHLRFLGCYFQTQLENSKCTVKIIFISY